MKITQIISCFLLLFAASPALAQNARFTTQGTIEYEKKVNMYAIIKDQVKRSPNSTYMVKMLEEYQKSQPQFKLMKGALTFSKDQLLFKPIEENVATNNMFGEIPVAQQNNITYTDLATSASTTQKKVFEETYLVKDSLRPINWKITNETRNIAGYDCRRANAVIMDSIYVVAFYAEEIPISGGPESFTGLPGMILGVALPYQHVTWFATAVTDQPITADKLKVPAKGKPINRKQLAEILLTALKNWGEEGKRYMKDFLL